MIGSPFNQLVPGVNIMSGEFNAWGSAIVAVAWPLIRARIPGLIRLGVHVCMDCLTDEDVRGTCQTR